MKRLFCATVVVLLVSHIWSQDKLSLDPTEALAKFDTFVITVADFEFYLQSTKSPFSSQLAQILTKKDQPIPKLLLDSLSEMAFQSLYVKKKQADKFQLEQEDLFLIRDELQGFAYDHWQNKLRQQLNITQKEIKNYYKANKAQFPIPERRQIAVLFLAFPDDEKGKEQVSTKIKEIRAKPDISKNFSEYIKQYSDMPNANQGGIIDYFSQGTYGKTIEEVAFRLKKGELSKVFSTRKGMYIIKCLDIQQRHVEPLDNVKGIIKRKLAAEKFSQLFDQAIKELREKSLVSVEEDLQKLTEPAATLIKVNEYELSNAVFFSVFPGYKQLALNNPEQFRQVLANLINKELVLQLYQQTLFNLDDQVARNYQIHKNSAYYQRYFLQETLNKFKVTDEEIKEYYDKYKGYYHSVTPKKLGYLLFQIPDKNAVSENTFFLSYHQMREKAEAFLHQVQKEGMDFVSLAKELAADDQKIAYQETDFLKAFPPEWNYQKDIIEFSPGRISEVIYTQDGFIVLKVLEAGKPDIFSLEEVKDKIWRVLFSQKQRDYHDTLKEQLLKQANYRTVF